MGQEQSQMSSKPGWMAIHEAARHGQEACLNVLLTGRTILLQLPKLILTRTRYVKNILLQTIMERAKVRLYYGSSLIVSHYLVLSRSNF